MFQNKEVRQCTYKRNMETRSHNLCGHGKAVSITCFVSVVLVIHRVVGPCHHGMARPQVADRGKASFMEGSCE